MSGPSMAFVIMRYAIYVRNVLKNEIRKSEKIIKTKIFYVRSREVETKGDLTLKTN